MKMTVSYTANVANSGNFPSAFIKLLRIWRGSIYQLIYFDLIIFLTIYYMINLSYRYVLTPSQQEHFCEVVSYFTQYNSQIPIIFVLGFYVSIVVKRWCDQIFKMPWPDPVATFVSALIRGNDERSRKMRRTVMRYVNLSFIMTFQLISPKVKKRFPNYKSLTDAGILVDNEKRIIEALDKIYPKLPKYWMPIVWASSVCTRARKEGKIRDDFALKTLNDELDNFRAGLLFLLHHDSISIPLVYTQVVTLAVYMYFGASVIGNQWIRQDKHFDYRETLAYYFPVFPTMEFFFFMGWMKVAETLVCPFGEDDDDFEINATIDRNIQVSYMIVDEMHNRHPQLIKDQYWDEVYPYELPGGGEAPPEYSTVKLEHKEATPPESFAMDHADKSSKRFDMRQVSTDSEPNFNEIFLRKLLHTTFTEDSFDAMLEDYSEESIEEEIIEGMTFERLREERERLKLQRQQLKILKTVENVSDLTTDTPAKTVLLTSDIFEKSPSETDDEQQNNTKQNYKPKKDNEPKGGDKDRSEDDSTKPGEQKKDD